MSLNNGPEGYSQQIALANVWKNPIQLLAVGLGSGLAPVAPGTFGTAAAIPLYLIIAEQPTWLYCVIVFSLFVVGIGICGQTSRSWGVHDHQAIVWDEVVGYLITMVTAPSGWVWVVLGFLVFRFFDIVKPWPVSWADKHISGGLGIMLDDGIAAVYSWFVLQLAAYYFLGV